MQALKNFRKIMLIVMGASLVLAMMSGSMAQNAVSFASSDISSSSFESVSSYKLERAQSSAQQLNGI